jgi:hypothetical protein
LSPRTCWRHCGPRDPSSGFPLAHRRGPGPPGARGWGHQTIQTHVVTFRIEHFDPAGRQLTPIPVETRGKSFYSGLSEGDWVHYRRVLPPCGRRSLCRSAKVHYAVSTL